MDNSELINCAKCELSFQDYELNDDFLCTDCENCIESQIKCESCSFLCDESDLNDEGVCSDCVDEYDMYKQQNEPL